MTTDINRLRLAYRRSGLALLGISFERALAVPMIRTALEGVVRAEDKAIPAAPRQPALI